MLTDFFPEVFKRVLLPQSWEKDPFVVKGSMQQPFLSLEELFSGIVDRHDLRIWISRLAEPKNIEDYLIDNGRAATQNGALSNTFGPKKKERFEDFFRRMNHLHYGVNVSNLQIYDHYFSERLQTILTELKVIPGYFENANQDKVTLSAFIGNYQSTPFGIHKDFRSIIVRVIKGERTYHFWSEEYFSGRKDDLGYIWPTSKDLDESESFSLATGDLIYWPSNRYHLITTSGAPSATVQLVCGLD